MVVPDEIRCIATDAFKCYLGLQDLRPEDFDDDALECVSTIREIMNTEAIDDPFGNGTYTVRAELLSTDQEIAF